MENKNIHRERKYCRRNRICALRGISTCAQSATYGGAILSQFILNHRHRPRQILEVSLTVLGGVAGGPIDRRSRLDVPGDR